MSEELPKAHNGCSCECHRTPGITHFTACCSPVSEELKSCPHGFSALSNSETERLALLAEECGEVIQAIGKILRHGYASSHPNGGKNNRQSLEYEISHVCLAVQLMTDAGDIDEEKVEYHKRLKNLKIGQYLHHQEDQP